GRPARLVAERVQLEAGTARADAVEVADEPDEQLRVGQRVVATEHLRADLVELPVPAALRPLAAEHRPRVEEASVALAVREAGLEVGPHDARRGLGPERDGGLLLGPIAKREHLLLHDVGRLADGPGEELGALEDRQPDLTEPVAREELARRGLEPVPVPALLGEDVPEAADGRDRARLRHSRD